MADHVNQGSISPGALRNNPGGHTRYLRSYAPNKNGTDTRLMSKTRTPHVALPANGMGPPKGKVASQARIDDTCPRWDQDAPKAKVRRLMSDAVYLGLFGWGSRGQGFALPTLFGADAEPKLEADGDWAADPWNETENTEEDEAGQDC
ncbi:uncharacterized protein Triagg1_2493 [Trichoderma aggressivum f. europaeum]|uniref:Uncharacterized protein n=1 Tax=Trichoderma aggressivum f. europaeum TaxID=173218 RepID=A0AAE1M1P0_9HYPO|nr:hypothetical protein Triagg1_2493 [Trichoderma aggressivum f. europaeum]